MQPYSIMLAIYQHVVQMESKFDGQWDYDAGENREMVDVRRVRLVRWRKSRDDKIMFT